MSSLYTPEQANKALPLVRRIVEDVVRAHLRWRDVVQELELLASGVRADQPDARATALEREALDLARELDAFERELSALGITLKDRQMGLIDFPGEREGRRVWLCWRLGESAVQYWHDLEAGFAGRRPLQPEPAVADRHNH
ncbi:MAG TPA: DUF2203 domain-containing protein [Gemmatimonadaceae bacterium]|nr:DUF2203 domain-containing protein [Gemmatimonadaceae bacterium]